MSVPVEETCATGRFVRQRIGNPRYSRLETVGNLRYEGRCAAVFLFPAKPPGGCGVAADRGLSR